MKKSLSYPVVLVGASLILVMVLSTYVIPNFMQLYGNVGAEELPTITVVVVGGADFVRSNLTILVPVMFGILIFLLIWRRTPSGRLKIDRWLLKLPVVGETIRQLTLAQVTRSLATLLAGG